MNFNPNATSPQITNPDDTVWELETWIESLSDDAESVALLWQIMGAHLRQFVR